MPALVTDIPAAEMAVIELTNAFRAREKLGAVKQNAALTAAARAFAKYLASTKEFSHTADGSGPSQRAEKAGYEYCEIAENIAKQTDSRGFESKQLARQAMDGWINSPGHRANLASPSATEIGVGIAKGAGANPTFVSVQLFGRPRSMMIAFQISNSSKKKIGYSFDGDAETISPGMAVMHSSCKPGTIVFSKTDVAGAAASYKAENGKVYTLRAEPAGGPIRVEVGTKERVE